MKLETNIMAVVKLNSNLQVQSPTFLIRRVLDSTCQLRMGSSQVGDLGSGAGKGGGGGGSIREAGGSFGKMEAAHEEEFFYKQQREQLAKLKDDLSDEISFHEEQIKRHQEAIQRNKNRVQNLDQTK